MAYSPAAVVSGFYCACGQPGINFYPIGRRCPLCEGCKFRFIVMQSAGRGDEFLADYDERYAYRYQVKYVIPKRG